MADRAVPDDPRVQRQLDRLARLSPGADTLGLERISALCARLGHPEEFGSLVLELVRNGYFNGQNLRQPGNKIFG